jgi:hypothetical protein
MKTNTVLGSTAPLAAAVTDDGNPPSPPALVQSQRPGAVFFDNAFTNIPPQPSRQTAPTSSG